MNTLKEKGSRIWFWDNVKFIMILLVVVGHITEKMVYSGCMNIASINLFIYSFHMPMFIFIFGIFFKPNDYLRKIVFYVSSGLLLKGLLYFSRLTINGGATFTLLYENGVPWFMFVLVWYTLAAWLFRRIDKRIVLAVGFLISLFTGYFKSVGDFLCFSRMFVFFPYFWLGTMINHEQLTAKIKSFKRYLLFPAAAVLIGWFLFCIFGLHKVEVLMHLFTGKNPFSYKLGNIGFLYRILTSAITLLTGAAILAIVPQRKIPLISHMGKNTINVYFWHYTFLYLIFHFFDQTEIVKTPAGVALMLFIAAALTFLLSVDIFNFPLKYLNKFIMNFKKRKATD